ncbi:MAG: hypothetical protein K2Z81_15875 [Cyanobacteria bacterium]|nr:hypothetical protein [Cyanobacteriota bacterium]
MSVVPMVCKEEPYAGVHDNGQREGYVFQVVGPSYTFPMHRRPIVHTPHRCSNGDSASTIIIPLIAAICFERAASSTLSFPFAADVENPTARISLTTEPNPYGKCIELAEGFYTPPESMREEESYREKNGHKVADVAFEMNEVKAFFLNLSFECTEDCPFAYGGTYHIWVNYWGYNNFCAIQLAGAPDHGALVDMKYGRPPRF